MFLPRIIPVLLLKNKGLVKTIKFKNSKYIGDPINTVKIFNDLKADELFFLDILASIESRTIDVELVKIIGDEAYMPFGVGGGIKDVNQIESLLKAGAEKVIINSAAWSNPNIISEASKIFGSQSIVVSIDVKKSIFGKMNVWIKNGNKNTKEDPIELAKKYEDFGAGEIIINSIDRDGMMQGYDLELIKNVSENTTIPVVACGGAGKLSHFSDAFYVAKAHALAAGSMFVYHGPRRGILINYPEKNELISIFQK